MAGYNIAAGAGGALSGAAAGTAILPGIGTVIGGIVGAVGGFGSSGEMNLPEWYMQALRKTRNAAKAGAMARGRTAKYSAKQSLTSRGLGNTTVVESVSQGIDRQVTEGVEQADRDFMAAMAGGPMVSSRDTGADVLGAAIGGLGKIAGQYRQMKGMRMTLDPDAAMPSFWEWFSGSK